MQKNRSTFFFTALPAAAVLCVLFTFCAAAETVPGALSYAPPEEAHIFSLTDGVNALDNELIVMAAPDTAPERIAALIAPYGGKIAGRIAIADEYQLRFDRARSPEALETLRRIIEGAAIVDRARLHTFTAAAPEYYDVGDMWRDDLANVADNQGDSWYLEIMDVPGAWQYMDTYADYLYPQKVGLIDTGFYPHEDLFFNETYNYRAGGYHDNYEHGTAVAGVIGASSRNSAGIMGVYPFGDYNLLGYSFFEGVKDYGEDSYYVYDYGMAWLLERGARVINVSMGDDSVVFQYYYDYVLRDEDLAYEWYNRYTDLARDVGAFMQRCLDNGFDFMIVNSAGNNSNKWHTLTVNGSDVDFYFDGYADAYHNGPFTRIAQEDFPDVYNRIMVVGSLRDMDTVSEFSSVGSRVDVYTPGEHILTTSPLAYDEFPSQHGYAYYDGTSLSAPLITGIAANILTVNPWLGCDDVRDIIKFIAGPYQGQADFPRNPNALTAVQMAMDLRDELALGAPNSYGITLRPRRGDVDRNGSVTTADARLALRAAIGLEGYEQSSINHLQADFNRDGDVTTGDARSILRVAVGLDTLSLKA